MSKVLRYLTSCFFFTISFISTFRQFELRLSIFSIRPIFFGCFYRKFRCFDIFVRSYFGISTPTCVNFFNISHRNSVCRSSDVYYRVLRFTVSTLRDISIFFCRFFRYVVRYVFRFIEISKVTEISICIESFDISKLRRVLSTFSIHCIATP